MHSLVKLDGWLVPPVPEQSLTLSHPLTAGRVLPLLSILLLHNIELLPGATLGSQLPLNPVLQASHLPVYQSHMKSGKVLAVDRRRCSDLPAGWLDTEWAQQEQCSD